jgi:DNA modification methylase
MSDLKIIYKHISEIKPYANNPRQNDAGVDAVAASIKEFGFKVPVIIDAGGEIIAGHTRIKAAEQLGLTKIPCVVADDLTEAQVKAFRIADNRVAELSTWDMDLLAVELQEIGEMDFDITLTGFGDVEIDDIMGNEPAEIIEDEIPEPPEEPTTKLGDLWQLGRHRLLCGDSTKPEDVQKLMDGELADMVFTDPPYNVDYTGGTNEALKIQNDNMDDSTFYNFLYDAFSCMLEVTKPGGGIYICHADSEGLNFRSAMVNAGWLLKQCIIWVKNSLVMGRQDYHWRHEPILYGWKPGAAHKWYGGRKQDTVIEDSKFVTITEAGDGFNIHIDDGVDTVVFKVPSYEIEYAADDFGTTVWRVDRPSRNVEHPTMKPIELVARAIRNSSKKDNIVLDTFGGSGSTLIACEQLNRTCYMMEIDPVYCDVIIQRWENLTGEKAVLANA